MQRRERLGVTARDEWKDVREDGGSGQQQYQLPAHDHRHAAFPREIRGQQRQHEQTEVARVYLLAMTQEVQAE